MANSVPNEVLDRGLGQAIRARRRSHGVSLAALADILGIGFDQVLRYERGIDRIDFSHLVAISQALGCRVADLVGDLDAPREARPIPTSAVGAPNEVDARDLLKAFAAVPAHIQRVALQLLTEIAREHREEKSATEKPLQ
jgi:transcriptional regulator with XRE-family HTH domain